jgi:hypothetical protein
LGIERPARPAPAVYEAARGRRAFCTEGSAALAFASGRARSNCGGLPSGRDRLTSRRVTTRTRLLGWLDPNGQLHETPNPHLLRIPQLFKHNLLERCEDPLGLSATDIGSISDGVRQLDLGQRQLNPSFEPYEDAQRRY